MSEDSLDQLKYLLKVDPHSYHHGCGFPQYRLDELSDAFDECTKLETNLWALLRRKENIVEVSFMEFVQSNTDGTDVQVCHLMSSGGPSSEHLRECRHTYFGDEVQGYVYCMDFGHIRAALKYLEEFFDGD